MGAGGPGESEAEGLAQEEGEVFLGEGGVEPGGGG